MAFLGKEIISMAYDPENIIQLGGAWNCRTKQGNHPYISTAYIKLSQEEIDKLREWQEDGTAVKFQVWKNKFKDPTKEEDKDKPDLNMIMIRESRKERD
jgi:hypothetical protein